MTDETNQAPVEATEVAAATPTGPELILRHVLLTKVDVSKTTIDAQFYLRRAELLSLTYKTDEEAQAVEAFFEASYNFRTVFSGADASRFSYAVYPAGATMMSSSPYTDVLSEVDAPKVDTIYSVLINVTEDDWKAIVKTEDYTKFVAARKAIKDILGWDIPEYRLAQVPEAMGAIDTLTFEEAAALWDASSEV